MLYAPFTAGTSSMLCSGRGANPARWPKDVPSAESSRTVRGLGKVLALLINMPPVNPCESFVWLYVIMQKKNYLTDFILIYTFLPFTATLAKNNLQFPEFG
jgi:hypothetical protein